jgi:hypothetical protein
MCQVPVAYCGTVHCTPLPSLHPTQTRSVDTNNAVPKSASTLNTLPATMRAKSPVHTTDVLRVTFRPAPIPCLKRTPLLSASHSSVTCYNHVTNIPESCVTYMYSCPHQQQTSPTYSVCKLANPPSCVGKVPESWFEYKTLQWVCANHRASARRPLPHTPRHSNVH